MFSRLKVVNRMYNQLHKEKERLLIKKTGLKESIDERYPFEVYGIKNEIIFEERSKKINEDLNLINRYINGFQDLIEIIEDDKAF